MKRELIAKAISLRKSGHSFKEISDTLGIAKSTASIWLKDIEVSKEGRKRLSGLVRTGVIKAADNKKRNTEKVLEKFRLDAIELLDGIDLNEDMAKISCGIMYWCEGGKYDHRVMQFTNSDPDLIATFLNLLRKSFDIDESKLRVCMHLHDYHSEKTQKEFWSKVTKISKNQFIKSYRKTNTGKRIRDNYQGCVMIKYYNADTIRELLAVGKAFLIKYRGVR